LHTSPHSPFRAVIIGAGAVGAHLAASLRRGLPLLVIDRSEPVRAAFEARGAAASPPPGHGSLPAPFRPGDIAILATSAAAATRAAAAVPPWVPLISLVNGLNHDLAAARSSLSYGVVEFAASPTAPGASTLTRPGWLTLQRHSPHGANAWLAAALDPRLQPARLSRDIDSHRHAKLMLNASLDPVAAIIGGTLGDVFRRPDSFASFRALLDEALTVARAAGWRLRAVQGMRPDVLSRIFRTPFLGGLAARAAARQAREVASTLAREVSRGDPGEAEHLCGAIAREGTRVGVPTPAHARALELLRRIASRSGSRSAQPDELLHELLHGSAIDAPVEARRRRAA
jgi:2-dehydropantoate 2-reductase